MAMNRETKRMLQRQGQLGPDGEATRAPRSTPQARPPRQEADRVGIFRRMFNFVREVRGELRKVAWPTRPEVVRYSSIVLVTIIVLTTLIFGLDYVFAKGIFFLFNQ